MFPFTSLVPSKVQGTANIEKPVWGPGNKYTRSLEGLTREKMLTVRSGCDTLVTRLDTPFIENSPWHLRANANALMMLLNICLVAIVPVWLHGC